MKRHIVALALTALLCSGASGQDYLSRPVKIVVPTGPGTIADTVTRQMAQDLTTQFGGQLFVVENRVGANGMIGASAVANSTPDGTTFIVGNVSTHAANEFLYNKLTYSPDKDFTAVSLVGSVPHVLVVSPQTPAKTYAELVTLAKQQPGKLNFASGSAGTIVALEMIKRETGIDVLHVPFKTVPQGVTELLGGRIDAIVADLGFAKPLIDDGKLRPILVTTASRSTLLPDVQAFPEVGLPKLNIVGWFGWFAPAGTPKEAVNRIAEGLKNAVARTETRNKLAALGVELVGSTPEELAAFTLEQRAMYGQLIKAAGIKME